MTILKQQLATMLEMQDAMNKVVNADWREQNYAWHRAIWVECAEMLDHYGWKWWKKQTPDLEQVRLELVDIFHFGLSLALQKGDSIDAISDKLALEITKTSEEAAFVDSLEQLASVAVGDKAFSIEAFSACLQAIDFSTDALFKHYVGKNALNIFRQQNGYQEGTYQKTWFGREDNEALSDILAKLDASDTQFKEKVMIELNLSYPENQIVKH